MRTREALPREWATTQNNLATPIGPHPRRSGRQPGEGHCRLRGGAHGANARGPAARVGETQNNLGIAYGDRIRGDRADNLEKAIARLRGGPDGPNARGPAARLGDDAVQPRHCLSGPHPRRSGRQPGEGDCRLPGGADGPNARGLAARHLRTARLLGSALLEARKWREAGLAYASARETFLLLFGQGLNDAEARDLIAEAGPLFAEAAFAAAQRGESEAALTLASEGRARLMAVALKLQTLDLPADKRRRLDELRTAIRAEERAVEATQGVERAAAVEKLIGLRQELLGLVKDAAQPRAEPDRRWPRRVRSWPQVALSWCRSSPRSGPRSLSRRATPLRGRRHA